MSATTPETTYTAEKVNIATIRGDSIGVVLRVWDDDQMTVPSDLSRSTVRAQVRPVPDGPLVGDWSVTVTGNEIDLVLPPKVARDLPDQSRWDCQVDWYTDDSVVTTVAYGVISAMRDVTHD